MFGDLDTDIQNRIPDRPRRPFPVAISDMPEIPWLASNYISNAPTNSSAKTLIARIVKSAIPTIGTIALLGFLGYTGYLLLSLY